MRGNQCAINSPRFTATSSRGPFQAKEPLVRFPLCRKRERERETNTLETSQVGPMIPLRLADSYSLRPRIISIYYPTLRVSAALAVPIASGPDFFLLFHYPSTALRLRPVERKRHSWFMRTRLLPRLRAIFASCFIIFRCFAIVTIQSLAKKWSFEVVSTKFGVSVDFFRCQVKQIYNIIYLWKNLKARAKDSSAALVVCKNMECVPILWN